MLQFLKHSLFFYQPLFLFPPYSVGRSVLVKNTRTATATRNASDNQIAKRSKKTAHKKLSRKDNKITYAHLLNKDI